MTTRSSEGLDERRRKLLYRSWHTGLREVDFILGPFADAQIDTLNDADLTTYETLLEVPSPVLMAWVMEQEKPPADYITPLFARLRDFHVNKNKA